MFRMKCGLLWGGIVCLALALPSVVHAAPAESQDVLVQKLEKAVKTHDVNTVKDILAATENNRGRVELLAFLDDHEAAGILEYTLQELFAGQVPTKWLLEDTRLELKSQTVICTITTLRLQVTVKEEGDVARTREIAAYIDPNSKRLVLPEGFLPAGEKQAKATTDLIQYRANLLKKITKEVGQGKFKSREEVAKAIEDDLKNSVAMQRFFAEVFPPEAAKAAGDAIGKALAEGLKQGFAEALRKAK